MHHRLILAGLAATGGLLTTAFLQAAVAVADTGTDVVSATGADAFTIGNYTFDPFTVPPSPMANPGAGAGLAPSGIETEGFAAVDPLSSAPPLLTLGGGTVGPVSTASQYLEVYSSSGTDLGSIDAGEDVTNLAGLTNTEFTVNDLFPASGEADSALPTVGSVYDSFNLGNGYDNVYTAIPGTMRSRHRHRHAGHAVRQRQPRLVVRQYRRRRAAAAGRRLHRSGRQRRRSRRLHHRRLHPGPVSDTGGRRRGLRPGRLQRRRGAAAEHRRLVASVIPLLQATVSTPKASPSTTEPGRPPLTSGPLPPARM